MAAITISDLTAPNTGYSVTLNTVTLGQTDTLDLSSVKDEDLVVLIQNSSTAEGTATVAAGVGSESSLGALTLTVPALSASDEASGNVSFTIEGARFKDTDGDVDITVTGSGFAGTIAAMVLPC